MKREDMDYRQKDDNGLRLKRGLKAAISAAAVMAVFFIIWLLVVIILLKCQ